MFSMIEGFIPKAYSRNAVREDRRNWQILRMRLKTSAAGLSVIAARRFEGRSRMNQGEVQIRAGQPESIFRLKNDTFVLPESQGKHMKG
jgi:hypothetical protein